MKAPTPSPTTVLIKTAILWFLISVLTTYYGFGAHKFYEIAFDAIGHPYIAIVASLVFFAATMCAAFDFAESRWTIIFFWITKPLIAFLYARHLHVASLLTCTIVITITDIAATFLAEKTRIWRANSIAQALDDPPKQRAAPPPDTNHGLQALADQLLDEADQPPPAALVDEPQVQEPQQDAPQPTQCTGGREEKVIR